MSCSLHHHHPSQKVTQHHPALLLHQGQAGPEYPYAVRVSQRCAPLQILTITAHKTITAGNQVPPAAPLLSWSGWAFAKNYKTSLSIYNIIILQIVEKGWLAKLHHWIPG